jgi:hypothetical protein
MPYARIDLDQAPESIRLFVAKRVEPYLRDVRVMLTAPLPDVSRTPKDPPEPALNMSIATVLCGVIGGLARVFYNEFPLDSESFQETAKRYPMEDEPTDAVPISDFANDLYDVYRCSLVHSLGLHMEDRGAVVKGRRRRVVVHAAERYVVARFNPPPLSESQLVELDRPSGRLAGLQATMKKDQGKVRLEVDALYCGVRRLVRVIATDPKRQAIAVPVLQPWFALQKSLEHERLATQSSSPQMTRTSTPAYSDPSSVESTTGAMRPSSSPWGDSPPSGKDRD